MMNKNFFIAVIAILLVIAITGATVFIYHKREDTPAESESETSLPDAENVAELKLDTVMSEGVALSFMKLSETSEPIATAATGN